MEYAHFVQVLEQVQAACIEWRRWAKRSNISQKCMWRDAGCGYPCIDNYMKYCLLPSTNKAIMTNRSEQQVSKREIGVKFGLGLGKCAKSAF